jgi:molybdenum-dependent DNA-binding transcriptional regulator ModE
MEILEAYDLTGSLRGAAKLAGCDHKTVAHWVHQRELAAGITPVVDRRRPAMESLFAAKIDELVDKSNGKIRADKAHDKLIGMGYQSSSTTS